MTPSQIEAAKALVASPWFRWMPRMVTMNRETVLAVNTNVDGKTLYLLYGARSVMDAGVWCVFTAWPSDMATRIPDLNDPATIGCLLALAREAWGDDGFHIACRVVTMPRVNPPPSWRGMTCDGKPIGNAWHYTEWEALVAAILAAPPKVTP